MECEGRGKYNLEDIPIGHPPICHKCRGFGYLDFSGKPIDGDQPKHVVQMSADGSIYEYSQKRLKWHRVTDIVEMKEG